MHLRFTSLNKSKIQYFGFAWHAVFLVFHLNEKLKLNHIWKWKLSLRNRKRNQEIEIEIKRENARTFFLSFNPSPQLGLSPFSLSCGPTSVDRPLSCGTVGQALFRRCVRLRKQTLTSGISCQPYFEP